MGFGPDGYLYVGIGDRAREVTGPYFGTILRLDVSHDDFPADASRNYAIPPGNPVLDASIPQEVVGRWLTNPASGNFDRPNLIVANTEPFEAALAVSHPIYQLQPSKFRTRFGTETPPLLLTGARRLGGPPIVAGSIYRGPVAALSGQYVFLEGRTIQSVDSGLLAQGRTFDVTVGLQNRAWVSVLGAIRRHQLRRGRSPETVFHHQRNRRGQSVPFRSAIAFRARRRDVGTAVRRRPGAPAAEPPRKNLLPGRIRARQGVASSNSPAPEGERYCKRQSKLRSRSLAPDEAPGAFANGGRRSVAPTGGGPPAPCARPVHDASW